MIIFTQSVAPLRLPIASSTQADVNLFSRKVAVLSCIWSRDGDVVRGIGTRYLGTDHHVLFGLRINVKYIN